jgi:hypothetical protein
LVILATTPDASPKRMFCAKCGREIQGKDRVDMSLGQITKVWHSPGCPPRPTPESEPVSDKADTTGGKPAQNPDKFH